MTPEPAAFHLTLPRPLMDLIRQCETNCVAGCCGPDAFDHDPKHLLPWLRQHQEQFSTVMDQISDLLRLVEEQRGEVVSADDFNASWDPKECEEFFRGWRATIMTAATKVYGSVPTLDPAWRTSDVLTLAKGIYDDRAFDRLPILADALQDAGCTNDDVLSHCRNDTTHARGCWVVDLVLGKS